MGNRSLRQQPGTGGLFHSRGAATGNAQSSTVDRHAGARQRVLTCSLNADDGDAKLQRLSCRFAALQCTAIQRMLRASALVVA